MRRKWRLAACAVLILISAALAALGLAGRHEPTVSGTFAASGRAIEPITPVSAPKGTVDVNTGDLYELTELPRIGEVIAGRIIENRETHGPFRYPEDLLSVNGIGIKTLEGFRDMLDLTVPE